MKKSEFSKLLLAIPLAAGTLALVPQQAEASLTTSAVTVSASSATVQLAADLSAPEATASDCFPFINCPALKTCTGLLHCDPLIIRGVTAG